MVKILTAAEAVEDFQDGTLPKHAVVQDTAADIAAFLDALEQIALSGHLRRIDISGDAVLTVSAGQVQSDAGALSKISGSYQLKVQDTAADVLAALPSLERAALQGRLQSITLTDGATLDLTAAQVHHDVAALLRVSGTLNEAVIDGEAAIAANLDQLEKLAAADKLAS